ncbi:hypothetical protein BJV82DRAFT_663731 [Fennellomyces sp. T-0311]|nr:hypothetical protein BJV82DRAFT_663731 [Fennellomyces sp. T-0311]
MYQDNYELPSIYNQKTQQPEPIEHESLDLRTGPSQHQALLNDDVQQQPRPYINKDRQLAWLLLFTPLLILIFTAVPATADLPAVDSMTTGDAIWRLIDPVITVPPNLFIMFCADTTRYHYGWTSTLIWLVWSIACGIYVQGHGVHLAAALFKHPVQDFILKHNDLLASNPVLLEELDGIYSYMRNLWEHDIAHYMYAFGAALMSWTQIAAFCDQVHGPLSVPIKVIFCIASLVYGLLIGAIAIDFPAGTIVGLVYTLALGSTCILLITLGRRKDLKYGGLLTLGRRMVRVWLD